MGSQTAAKQAKVEAAAPASAVEPPRIAAIAPAFGSNRALARMFRSAGSGSRRAPQALPVAPPDDLAEREAERVAGEVMRMPAGGAAAATASSSPPAVQRKCAACEDELFVHQVMVEFEDVMFAEKEIAREPGAQTLRVTSVPTFVWLDANGNDLGRFDSAGDADSFRSAVEAKRAAN